MVIELGITKRCFELLLIEACERSDELKYTVVLLK